jgi:hypothetical protein
MRHELLGQKRPQATTLNSSKRPAMPAHMASILELQRQAGNKATAGLLAGKRAPLQRFTVRADYALGAVPHRQPSFSVPTPWTRPPVSIPGAG